MFHENKNDGAQWDQLSSDADFKAEALRLLPKIAKQQAEEIWLMMKRKLKLNSSQRTSVVNEMMQPYKNRSSAESRDMLTAIEAELRKGRPSGDWLGTGCTRVSKSTKHKT